MLLDNQGILKTSADELFDLVKKSKKISVEDAVKILKLPHKTVQGLVDFLVEEKIFGLEYKFTTPYIYLSKSDFGKKLTKITDKISPIKKLTTKEDFYAKAKQRGLSHEKIEGLWRKYLNQNLSYIKNEFFQKAKSRNVPENKIENLWMKYLSYLT